MVLCYYVDDIRSAQKLARLGSGDLSLHGRVAFWLLRLHALLQAF